MPRRKASSRNAQSRRKNACAMGFAPGDTFDYRGIQTNSLRDRVDASAVYGASINSLAKRLLKYGVVRTLRPMSRVFRPRIDAQRLQRPPDMLELFGISIALMLDRADLPTRE